MSVDGPLVFAGAPALETFIATKAVAVTFGADARSRRLALHRACEPAVLAAPGVALKAIAESASTDAAAMCESSS